MRLLQPREGTGSVGKTLGLCRTLSPGSGREERSLATRYCGRSELNNSLVLSFDLYSIPKAEKRTLTQKTLTVSVRGLNHRLLTQKMLTMSIRGLRLGGCVFLPLWPPHGETVFCHLSPHVYFRVETFTLSSLVSTKRK